MASSISSVESRKPQNWKTQQVVTQSLAHINQRTLTLLVLTLVKPLKLLDFILAQLSPKICLCNNEERQYEATGHSDTVDDQSRLAVIRENPIGDGLAVKGNYSFATENAVANVSRHVHCWIVQVGGLADEVQENTRKGVDVQKGKRVVRPPAPVVSQPIFPRAIWKTQSSVAGRKRSSSSSQAGAVGVDSSSSKR
ncbi:hypothetical protein V8C37DRAFT_403321 [Trichoderma ceciliae]